MTQQHAKQQAVKAIRQIVEAAKRLSEAESILLGESAVQTDPCNPSESAEGQQPAAVGA